MNLYQITSPNIGTTSLIVKAKNTQQASQVARDVIDERRMTNDEKYDVHVTELVQPEDDGVGYCYPLNNVKTFKY
jgi:hypothetical protein